MLAVVGVVAMGVLCWPHTVDDAFIVARYAQTLASGGGYAMNPGGPVSDGVTGPLWLLPGLLSELLSLDPVVGAKLAGLCCVMLAVFLVVRRAGHRAGGGAAAIVTAIALGTQPTLGSWAVAGLETGAATLAFTVLGLASVSRPIHGRWWLALAAGAVPWLRPELVPAAAVLLIHLWRRDSRIGARAIGVAIGSGVLLVGIRLQMFGDLMPLAASAKPVLLSQGLGYAIRSVVVTTGLGGILLVLAGCLRGRRDDRVLGLALLVHLGALVAAGGDWMPGFRLLAPVLPLYAYLLGVGFVRLRRSRRSSSPLVHRGRWVLLLLSLALPFADLSLRVAGASEVAVSRAGPGSDLADDLRSSVHRVAMVDVGFLAYASGVEVVDLGGVTDPAVAASTGGHLDKRIDERLLVTRDPDAIVLHSRRPPRIDAQGQLLGFDGYPVELRVAAMPWVREHFRVQRVYPYAPHYYYLLLLRRPAPSGR